MKIAVLCNYKLLPNRIGGMDYFFWGFDEEVKKLGYQIDWFFPNLEYHGSYKNFTIFSSESSSIENYFLGLAHKNKEQYDFIFCHFLELCTSFYKKLKKLLPIAQVIVIDHNPRPLKGYSFKKKLQKRVKGFLYARYIDKFIGVSQYTLAEILKDFGTHLKAKTQVIYNGILTDNIRVKQERNHQNPKFLTACHLRYSKGIQDLIVAVNLLPNTIKNDLVIAVYGDGDYKEELQKLIQTLDVETNFIFKGNSPNLGSVFYTYDYLIQPTHMECFSLGILESLAANIPVISTPVGGNLEVIKAGFNGFIFNARDCLALKNIIENIVLGKLMIKQNTSLLVQEEFTLAKMVENYLKLIH
jgi:glycosyltransferase involved in cell wall biosynthesis